MAKTAQPQPEKPLQSDEDGPSLPRINNPRLDDQGKPTQRAITSAKHAHTIAKNLYDDAVGGRLTIAAMVSGKYNGDPPYNARKLKEANMDWRNNFTTQFMASIIDRVKPQFLDPVNRADRITFAALPAEVERGQEKSAFFQERLTRLIRKQPEWPDTLSMLSQEVVTHGGAVPGWLDDAFMPRVWRTDEVFLPEGTGQHASKVQTAVFLQKILIHDFMQIISDRQAAEDAHYNLKGCYAAVNGSDTENERTPVEESDAARENAGAGYNYMNANQTVDIFHVVVREWDGSVHLWSVSFRDGHEIRHVENIQADMTDALTLFTLQTGNTKFYGSKGLGRLICNLHIAIERNRCLAADMIYLAGLLILQSKGGGMSKIQPVVMHPFLVVDGDVEIAKSQIQFDAEGFLALDKMFVGLAESIAGAFIPPNLDNSGSSNTKIEAAQRAEREMAVRQGVLGRFFQQFSEMVQAMQRKICSAENLKEAQRRYKAKKEMETQGLRGIVARTFEWLKKVIGDEEIAAQRLAPLPETKIADPDCVEALCDMLDYGLTVEEIIALADASAGNEVQNNGEALDERTVNFLKGEEMNPHIDQVESTKIRAEIMMGKERSKRTLLKDAVDPNVQNQAIREQTIEFSEMLAGNPIPVVSTDNHKLHRRALIPMMTPIIGMLQSAPTPEMMITAELGLSHFAEHLNQDRQTVPEERAQEEQIGEEWLAAIEASKQMLEQLAAQAAQAGTDPNAMPPAIPGAEGMNQPGDPLAEDAANTEKIRLAHEMELKGLDADHREREQARKDDDQKLKREEFEHRKEMDLANLQKEVALQVETINQKDRAEAGRAAAAQAKQSVSSGE